MSKLNESSTDYSLSSHKFLTQIGSIRQSSVHLTNRACYRLSSNQHNDYPIIIDSGATHHMWADHQAFTSFTKMENCYVTLANNYKIPTLGRGTIQLVIAGYVIQLHDVYHVPNLQFSLYSVKQHRRYLKCSCIFDNNSASLNFPKFKFDIDDECDMVIYGRSDTSKSNKIHWSSLDGSIPSVYRAAKSSTPIPLPSHKPNPNKNVHRRITNIDIHKYLGFCTLKNIKIFQSVAQNNVTFVNAGELPLSHGDMATIQRHKSNKECVQRPKHFFDIAHMDITYGDTVAPGGIKYALVIVASFSVNNH